LKPKRERVKKDSKRVEAKKKCWGGGEKWETLHFWVGEKEHLIVRRFPGSARSSF
jgi:hypothetical protein